MCHNEKLRTLKLRIEEAARKIEYDGADIVTELLEELQTICPHTEKRLHDNELYICTCCDKLFVHKRA